MFCLYIFQMTFWDEYKYLENRKQHLIGIRTFWSTSPKTGKTYKHIFFHFSKTYVYFSFLLNSILNFSITKLSMKEWKKHYQYTPVLKILHRCCFFFIFKLLESLIIYIQTISKHSLMCYIQFILKAINNCQTNDHRYDF